MPYALSTLTKGKTSLYIAIGKKSKDSVVGHLMEIRV